MRCVAVLMFLSFAACLSEPPEQAAIEMRKQALDPEFKSGSVMQLRVKTTTLQGGDGSMYKYRSDAFFYNTLTEHYCEFISSGTTGSTITACYPTSDLSADGTYPGDSVLNGLGIRPPVPGWPFTELPVYSDAACSQRVAALWDPSGKADTSALVIRVTGDPMIYGVGTEVTSILNRMAHFYQKSSPTSACKLVDTHSTGMPVDWRIFELDSSGPATAAGFVRTDAIEILP